jgi:hypothetical protein
MAAIMQLLGSFDWVTNEEAATTAWSGNDP